jgi:hypothetical protein
MKLDTNFLRNLTYVEMNLKDLELEIVPTSGTDDEDESGVGVKGDDPLTENALKHLCGYLKIPYPFAKQLRSQGRSNVLSYIQRQLSQVNQTQVVLVGDNEVILGVTENDKLHYRGDDLQNFDSRIRTLLASSTTFELGDVVFENGLVNYYLFYKETSDLSADDSKWKWGFVISLSALGDIKPSIGVVVQRIKDVSLAILPAKTHSYPLDFSDSFDEKWEQIVTFLQNPPAPQWITLSGALERLTRTTASFKEVKEARAKLQKLKIDSDDSDTLGRINNTLQWKRINKEYALKDLGFKPTKVWFARATTPLTLFDVFNCITREATAAPNTVPYEIRKNLYSYAGSLLLGEPDLYMLPPVISW